MKKALTIKQPWASLIAHGIKDIENRSWKTNYRGEFLIHAGLDTVFDGYMPSGHTVGEWLMNNGFNWHYNNIQHGAIIGKAELIDCVQNHSSIWAEKNCYNWVLANPVLYKEPLLNIKGKLSFWEYENKKQG